MIIIILLLILFFGIWTFLVHKGYLKKIDDKVYKSLKIKQPYISIFKSITFLGSTKYFVVMATLLIVFLQNKRTAFLIAILLIIDALLVSIFKNIMKRERPNIKQLVKEKGYSYPSGHTFTSNVFYGFIIFLVLMSELSLILKVILIVLLICIIFLIGFSRIFLGVHYFSDVIGAYFSSTSYLLTFIWIVTNILKLI